MRQPKHQSVWLVKWSRMLQALCAGLLLAVSLVQAQQAVPGLTGHVVDTSTTLDAAQSQQLEAKLAAFEQSRGAQIVLLLVPTTQPEDIASYAQRVADSWKIGRKGIGDGLLLVVAKNDRKVRIEVAKSLEGAIPDLASKRVIDEAITPHFRQGDFAGGLDAASEQIMALISAEALPEPAKASVFKNVRVGFDWMDLAVFVFFAVPVAAAAARRLMGVKLAALVTGGAVGVIALLITSSLLIAGVAALAALLFTLVSGAARGLSGLAWGAGHHSGWGGGGSFGSGSGGGFSSGGGGDFGGGGASGDW
ncbi:MAG: TPM domain-containing protein [Comamonadaceae bacterium]